MTTAAMSRITGLYPPPRHNVLLLTCMDLRLIDELAAFMDRDNLTNRYDHLVFAGASLGVLQTKYPEWKCTFKQHLAIALQLHQPEDIYIVEHRNCGAYVAFLGLDFEDHQYAAEKAEHTKWATRLRAQIEEWWPEIAPRKDGKLLPLHIHGFLMDLRGDVELLDLAPEDQTTAPKDQPPARKTRKTKSKP